jgi:plastocyanin
MRTLRLATAAVAAAAALLLAACGGGGSKTTVTNCAPSGTKFRVSAHNFEFDTTCLAAPANTPFTITLDNQDAGQTHNVAIYTNSSATTTLFQGDLIFGIGTGLYRVKALPAGRYFFRCDVHPQMNGTFNVK